MAREEGLLIGGSGGTAVYAAIEVAKQLGPGQARRHADPRQRPRLPLEVLRRQLHARARLPRAATRPSPTVAEVLSAKQRRGAGHPGPDHDRVPPEGRRGDRPHAALLDLAAAGRARRRASTRSPTSSARSRIATCSTASSRTRTRCTRTSPPRCSRRWPRSTSDETLDEVFSTLTGGRANAVVVAERRASRSACSPAPTCSSTWRTAR